MLLASVRGYIFEVYPLRVFIGEKMKPFKTIEEQIEILHERGLDVKHPNIKEILFKEGYYNIINGYKDIFLEDESSENFKENARFIDIYNLYHLDRMLRNQALNACMTCENIIKTSLSYEIANHYGVKESEYLKRSNYRSRKKNGIGKKNKYILDDVLDNLNYILKSKDEPYIHYRNDHNHIPPWILLKGANFWTIKTFFTLQKEDVKNAVTASVLGKNIDYIHEEDKRFLSDIIHLIYKFRNRAAHSGRIYNYKIVNKEKKVDKDSITYYEPFHNELNITKEQYNEGYGRFDFYTFYYSTKRILTKDYFDIYRLQTIMLIERVKSLYKHDYIKILQLMGVPTHKLLQPIKNIF